MYLLTNFISVLMIPMQQALPPFQPEYIYKCACTINSTCLD